MNECDENFVFGFELVQRAVHGVNSANGFWDVPDKLMELSKANMSPEDAEKVQAIVMTSFLGLMDTEVSECIEGIRKSPKDKWASLEKDSVTRELADLVIRAIDFAEAYKLPLAEAIIVGLEHNRGRGWMHGGKKN